MKNIYITWHYTNHGIAYFKHVLSRFFLDANISKDISFGNVDQIEMNQIFDTHKDGFVFDEVIYLTSPQESFDSISSRRFSYKETILKDNFVIENDLVRLYEELITKDFYYCLDAELSFVERTYPEHFERFKQSIWRNIQHYPILEQIKWLREFSNLPNDYFKKIEFVELDIKDLRDEKQIAEKLFNWILKYFSKNRDANPIINVSLGTTETSVVWHVLGSSDRLPAKTRFIKTYDDKSDNTNLRFKKFDILEISPRLVIDLPTSLDFYPKTYTPLRKLVDLKMKAFILSGFSVLILGERGIGKTQIAEKQSKEKGMKFFAANCASFPDDEKAEAELFGYVQGAFTDAKKDKIGLLEEANGGTLFLDEIHFLSKLVQAKLMKSIQTDQFNKMSIRRVGSTKEIKVECRLIFASNRTVNELKMALLPDFYDRIVQHVIVIPPLRETKEDIEEDWENVWEGLFHKKTSMPVVPKDRILIDWLKSLPLFGNYRDLQKIAMYYNVYNEFSEETKRFVKEKSAFGYAKAEFEKYHGFSSNDLSEKFNFNTNQTTKEMIADYLFELQEWAVKYFNGRNLAEQHFRSLGDTVSVGTFNTWKNKKSIRK